MNELKPCPFCSGEAEVLESGHSATFYCWCDSCETRGNYYNTEAEAIEAWNTRAERTCKVDVLNTGDCAGYECSEYIMHCNGCGHEFGHVLYNEDGDVWMSEPPRYCPNCGAKVVDA